MDYNLTLTLDFREYPIDWQQPVDILEAGGLKSEYRLRDPESNVTATDESYLQARRKLSLARTAKQEMAEQASRTLSRELSHHCTHGGVA